MKKSKLPYSGFNVLNRKGDVCRYVLATLVGLLASAQTPNSCFCATCTNLL